MTVLEKELLQVSAPVVRSVVQDQVEFAPGVSEDMVEELAKGFAVEGGGLLGKKAPRLQVDGPKVAHLLASGRGEDPGLLSLGRPHPGQGAVSLEVYFVLAPELNVGFIHPLEEVFLNAFCWTGSAS